MTVTTVSIVCDIGLADDAEYIASSLEFTLSGPDYDTASNDTIVPGTVKVTLDADGIGTVALWPVDRGAQNRSYRVDVIGSRVINGATVAERFTLGKIRPVVAGAPHDLATLLAIANPDISEGLTVYEILAQQAAASAVDAATSASLAEAFAEGIGVNAAAFGASASASAATNGAALVAAAAVSDIVRVDEDLVATASFVDLRDCNFIGSGSITGVFRKRVIPDLPHRFAPSNGIAPRHIRALSRPNPVVVLVGDSISTYNANTTGRSDMLAVQLERALRAAAPVGSNLEFFNRSIGGQTFNVFHTSVTTTDTFGNLTWWVNGRTWKQQVEDLNPDIVVFSFGMNDASGVRVDQLDALTAQVKAWSGAPEIIFCTNLLPSLGADGVHILETDTTNREYAAGTVRSYAEYYGYGLFDFNRQFIAARDAFDCRSSTVKETELASVLSGAQLVAPRKVKDFIVEFDVNADNMVADDAGDVIVIKIGSAGLDWLRINKTSGPLLRLRPSTGPVTNPVTYKTVDVPWLGSGAFTLRVEVKDNNLTLYNPAIGGPEGTNNPPIWSSKIITAGGDFTPAVYVTGTNDIVSNVSYFLADQQTVAPSITDAALFNGEDGEGSLYNHPGNYLAAFVYRPVLDASNLAPDGLDWGVYTPTVSSLTNLSAATVTRATWSRVGPFVDVSYTMSLDPVAAGACSFKLTLPPDALSNFTQVYDARILGADYAVGQSGAGYADTAGDLITFSFVASSTAAQTWNLHGRYEVK